MNSVDVNALWNDPDNWDSSASYRCAADPRLFVPKRGGGGWTLNMAHASAQPAMWVVLLAITLTVLVLGLWARHGG